jgi:hypothetical protein
MAYTLKVTLNDAQWDTLQERAEQKGIDPEDSAALADDLVKVWWGRLKALSKHQRKLAVVRADPIGHGLTFEPRKPFLAPDALDTEKLVNLGLAPEPKAKETPKAPAKGKRKARARAQQSTLPGMS